MNGEWRLTTQETKRILLNNIYGVDIDSQAVEVTKLSLLLKVLEGENDETLKRQLSFVKERALPDLGNNIKCGNSLIGPDYFTGQLLPDEEEMRRVNPFDWHAEFSEIMSAGGFDAVIGNPPYVRQESLSDFKGYFATHYEAFDGVADLYAYFMERGIKLLHDGGRFSCIVSSSFFRTTYGEPLRRMLKKHAAVLRILDFGGLPVFENAKDTYVCIPLLEKTKQTARIEVARITSFEIADLDSYAQTDHFTIPHQRLSPEAWALRSDLEAVVFEKVMKAGKPLGEYLKGQICYGIKTGLNEAFVIDSATRKILIAKDRSSAELIKPLLGGEDIRRYIYHKTDLWLIFTRRGVDINRHPAIRDHLFKWKPQLTPKKSSKDKVGRKPGSYQWYEIQDDVAYFKVFDGPKIIYPDITKTPRFALDMEGQYLTNTAYCLGTGDRYLLGILNSRLFWFTISNISIPFGIRAGKYRYRLIYQYMEKVPIRVIDFGGKLDKTRHDRMVLLVSGMLELYNRLAVTTHPDDKDRLQRQLEAADYEIDQLVYDLYGLTKEEIEIVERASIASSQKLVENENYETAIESADQPSSSRRAAPSLAQEARHSRESSGGTSEGLTGASEPVHGVREPAREYGSSGESSEGQNGKAEDVGSTRYFETAEGHLSYNEISERLAVPLVALLDEILRTSPQQILISEEWLCGRHKRLAGHLYPEWAGRYRDVDVRVGLHNPPPYYEVYEVRVHMRQFLDDLAERLRHPFESTLGGVVEFFAWVDWHFQWIHPFKDFNGRIGRVLLAALLFKLGLPHVETAPVNADEKEQYLAALRAADGGNLEALQQVWLQRFIHAL